MQGAIMPDRCIPRHYLHLSVAAAVVSTIATTVATFGASAWQWHIAIVNVLVGATAALWVITALVAGFLSLNARLDAAAARSERRRRQSMIADDVESYLRNMGT